MKKYLPILAIIFAALLWSLDGYLRQELYNVSSFLIVTIEHVIGAIVFLPFLLKGKGEIYAMGQRAWSSIFWISVFGGLFGLFFYTKALSYINYIDLSVVVLLQKFQPLFAISLAAVVLKERITKRFLILAIMALMGGYFVTFGLNPIPTGNDKATIAALLAFLAAFCWGSSTVLGKHALKTLSFPVVTALRLSVTAIIAVVVLVAMRGYSDINLLTLAEWKIILLIVFTTGSVALFIYYYGLKHVKASHSSIYELFWPLSAVVIDWIIRGRILSLVQFIGGTVLIISIILLTREQQKQNGKTNKKRS
ncbi:MAG: DMT family transporter [Candidatus Neomarinimicrobiota bacterium]